jgi:hypothetical protein
MREGGTFNSRAVIADRPRHRVDVSMWSRPSS